MQGFVPDTAMLALFNLGGGEIVLIVLLLLVMIGARRLPDLTRGFGRGIGEIRKALDEEAHGAGKSLGGIYGKPAAEALTPDNQVAELYDPAVFQDRRRSKRLWRRLAVLMRRVYRWIRKALFC